MALTLMAGPANAGKVALLLDRYLADIDREPVLIVPTGSDVERVERDLLTRCGALMGGSIGTFDDVFDRIASGNGGARAVAGDAQRALVLRRVVAGAKLDELDRSARFAGFADSLGTAIAELEAGLLDPDELDGDLAELYRRYRAELDRLGLWDRDLRRSVCSRPARRRSRRLGRPARLRIRVRGPERGAVAVARGVRRPGGRHGVAPVRAGAGGLLLARAHGLRPGGPRRRAARGASAPVRRTSRIPRWRTSSGRSSRTSRPRRRGRGCDPLPRGRRHARDPRARRGRDPGARARRHCSGARSSSSARRSTGFVRRSRSAFGALGVPYALDAALKSSQTPYGHALLSLLRYAWLGGGRRELFGFVRSPYSGLAVAPTPTSSRDACAAAASARRSGWRRRS